ncbi:hypothetical protein NHX12_007602 [Muraenolepis orangiensis]|uniref:Uncharacterized protein n=1 Tax=Muraenolepis orangiensis TaxID=630683 RepID=A0A9Q0DSQ4_9TELE|nr:hypothetical protein NHX12_007602 [Muraenolepis orangiensis]
MQLPGQQSSSSSWACSSRANSPAPLHGHAAPGPTVQLLFMGMQLPGQQSSSSSWACSSRANSPAPLHGHAAPGPTVQLLFMGMQLPGQQSSSSSWACSSRANRETSSGINSQCNQRSLKAEISMDLLDRTALTNGIGCLKLAVPGHRTPGRLKWAHIYKA